jgi:uncharacterized protein YqhQ
LIRNFYLNFSSHFYDDVDDDDDDDDDNDDENDQFRDMFIHVISVNILMFLLSPTISTLNQFGMTVNRSDEGILT